MCGERWEGEEDWSGKYQETVRTDSSETSGL